ncbi:hypothetical protein CCR95_20895 [Thiocystis minor]|uniref:DUF927 domain-containing protein n=1 Tax=Thiocystis minor TaxID=61597 RepID=UPI00191142F2|nr:DUF927 domain-containing protein [Thiocystis minor]MBK5966464.1 hypothetical protein [Thiocystis minor]
METSQQRETKASHKTANAISQAMQAPTEPEAATTAAAMMIALTDRHAEWRMTQTALGAAIEYDVGNLNRVLKGKQEMKDQAALARLVALYEGHAKVALEPSGKPIESAPTDSAPQADTSTIEAVIDPIEYDSSDDGADGAEDAVSVSNHDFLAALFAGMTPEEYLWACEFIGHPKTDAQWGGHMVFGTLADYPACNTYFSVSALKPDASGARKRRKENFSRQFVVVLDDSPPLPGIDSTWTLETSHPEGRSNTQVGYRLVDPITDMGIASRLNQALGDAGHLPIDTSGNNPVRYVRLPVGSNTKYQPAHQHRLLAWNPDGRVTLDELIGVLGFDRDAILNEPVPPPKPEQVRADTSHHDRSEGGFFRSVKDAALANMDCWVPVIFPSAKPYQGGYRVTSKSLGRPHLEEDLSLHPSGIKDHGEEHGLTAIDVVMKWGTPARTANEAALWLCSQIGIDPVSLGWNEPTPDAFDESEIPDDLDPVPPRSIQAPDGWKLTRSMVFEAREKKDETEYLPVCGHLRVTGRTNGAHGDWGLVLAFRDHDGKEIVPPAIPAERLHEDAGILARELARQGLKIIPGKEKRLLSYLASWETDVRILSAKRLGWLEDPTGALSFVMPDRVITRDGTKQVVFQPDRYSPTVRTVHASGTLAQWQIKVAAPVCRHRPMLFALCAGLTPALLAFAEAGDSFVIHFWGKTSRGKTTVGQISASPWGCAADPNDAPSLTFIRRWNVTGNGLEGLAESHSDMPLVLDELGSSTVGDIRPLIYQLAGGQGKTALNSAREMKEPRSWRTIAISTGELSLHARMSDPDGDGTRTRNVKGGLTHRALDVEIADIAGASPASERESVVSGVKVACARTYGTAGPELVRLIAEQFSSASAARQYVRDQVAVVTASLIADQSIPAETARAVRRFALIAVAGEFAAHAGLIPVEASEVRAAVKEVVTAWLGASAETDEDRIVSSVRAFILKHESRFQRINEPEPETRTGRYGNEYPAPTRASEPVRDRAGYVDHAKGHWYFTDAGLVEAAPGNDKTTIARTLKKAGYLSTSEGKLQERVTIGADRPRMYSVKTSILDGEKSGESSETGGHGGQGGQPQQTSGLEPVHPEKGQGGQGGQGGRDAMDDTTAVHPVHLSTSEGGQEQNRAVAGAVHPVHPVHPENKDPEFFSVDDNGEVAI